MNIFKRVKEASKIAINKRFEHWLKLRLPSRFKHKLSNRNIFIMPTRFGFAYLFFDLLLFLLGTNYQNSIILLLSFLLASLFITVMMHSFYNFSQLSFSSKASQNCFAKQILNFPITITGHKSHYDINIQFAQSKYFVKEVKVEQCGTEAIEILLPWYAKYRGVHTLGRVKVFSEYSLGLFITWSLLDFSHEAIVYPEPKKLSDSQKLLLGLNESDTVNGINMSGLTGSDDFSELKSYVIGESLARIAWKQLARGQGKLSKNYQAQQGSLIWLKLSDMPSSNIELKLEFLCFLIIEYSKNMEDFGLILDLPSKVNQHTSVKIDPNSGFQHQENCLIALANVDNPSYDH